MVTQQCACGHLQSRTSCGASFTNPSSRETVQLKCNSECMVRQRNARLADALGIKSPIDRTLTEWSPDLKAFARQNHSFVLTVEQTFKDFILGARTTLILPHMPPAKRTFVIGMADVYHLGRELIDAEPNRSVQIRRRIDTRLPNPLLSAAAPAPVATRLGGLANLRANASSPSTPPVASSWSAGRPAAGSSTTAATVATPPTSLPTSRVPSPGIGAPSASAPAPTPVPTAPVAAPLAPVVPTPVRATVMPHTNIPVPVVNVYSLSVGDDDDWDHSGDEA
ncbi:FKBP12-associated protein [Apiotrichum porosum]|uniref:FKBP12-associated protein n=1 Tax=Apiotrichum porosum TaxID=105984 RepID=A0A427YB81_9TREE|nr:FKBP12-associated protein [Apiotrichum porosum]RSH88401.1 FKBP12-associated protein [Apiotrichum porosum]